MIRKPAGKIPGNESTICPVHEAGTFLEHSFSLTGVLVEAVPTLRFFDGFTYQRHSFTYQQVFHKKTIFWRDKKKEHSGLRQPILLRKGVNPLFSQSNSLYGKELAKTNYRGCLTTFHSAADDFILPIYPGLSTIYPQKDNSPVCFFYEDVHSQWD
jgi:hypothetical protein